jgi:DNA-binding CsgD family transcriptional regulator
VVGIRSVFAGELDDARAAFEIDHAAALESGDVAGRPRILAHLADLELRAGRWEDARRYAREGLELAEQEDHPEQRAALLAVHARVCAHLGEIDDARALATRGAKLAGDAKSELARLQNEAALGFVELSLQRMQEADGYLRSLPAAADRMGFVEPAAMPFVFDAIEAMIEAGALDEARDHIERLEACAGERTSPCVRGAMRRSRGFLCAATGRLDEAEAALREALQAHEASAEPFEHARTLLALGTTLRRAKQKRAGREAIEASLDILERLGAPTWADRARGELARIGGRKPSPDGLTPTERRVAELVADGCSNKEVAAALHVTVKTVEGTLSRVYAKVGVRSRTGLAGRFAAKDGAPAKP